jgi:hypothetical protein
MFLSMILIGFQKFPPGMARSVSLPGIHFKYPARRLTSSWSQRSREMIPMLW